MFSSCLDSGKNLRTIYRAKHSVELIFVNGLLFLFFLSPLMYKYIKSGKITVPSRCYVDAPIKFVAPETHVKCSVQKGEATRVIYLHELLWLIAL